MSQYLPPVRCYTCGKLLAHLYEPYWKRLSEDVDPKEALDATGLPPSRFCCRTRIISQKPPWDQPMMKTFPRKTEHYEYLDPPKDVARTPSTR